MTFVKILRRMYPGTRNSTLILELIWIWSTESRYLSRLRIWTPDADRILFGRVMQSLTAVVYSVVVSPYGSSMTTTAVSLIDWVYSSDQQKYQGCGKAVFTCLLVQVEWDVEKPCLPACSSRWSGTWKSRVYLHARPGGVGRGKAVFTCLLVQVEWDVEKLCLPVCSSRWRGTWKSRVYLFARPGRVGCGKAVFTVCLFRWSGTWKNHVLRHLLVRRQISVQSNQNGFHRAQMTNQNR